MSASSFREVTSPIPDDGEQVRLPSDVLAELLMDAEEDPYVRAVLVGMLREYQQQPWTGDAGVL